MSNNGLKIIGILFLSLIFLLGCTSNQPKTDQQNILAPPKSLCADAFKGGLDYGQVLNAGRYTVTLNTITFGSPNQVTVTVKDLVSGDEKKETLTEGKAVDLMFGTSKVTVLFSGMDYSGSTKAKFEVCYDHPKKCETPIAKGVVNEGEKLDISGTYLVSMVSIKGASPSVAHVEILDSKTMVVLAKADLVEGVPTEVMAGGTKLVLTFSMTFATVPKPQIEVCGEVKVAQPSPSCNPTTGLDSGTIMKDVNLMVKERYLIGFDSAQEIMGKRYVTVTIYDGYSDELGTKVKKETIEEGKTVVVTMPGNKGTSGEVTITVTKVNVDIVASKSSADIVTCAKLPAPIKCVPSVEDTRMTTLGLNEVVLLSGRYQLTFEKVDVWIDGKSQAVQFRLYDFVNKRQNFITVKEGTSIDFAFSDTVLVLDVSLITFDAEGKPHITLTTCAKGSEFSGGIIS